MFSPITPTGRTRPRTLVEELRRTSERILYRRTVDERLLMRRAADEIERAAAEIKFLRRILGSSRQHHADVAGVISIDDNNEWQYHHMPVADLEETWKRGTGE